MIQGFVFYLDYENTFWGPKEHKKDIIIYSERKRKLRKFWNMICFRKFRYFRVFSELYMIFGIKKQCVSEYKRYTLHSLAIFLTKNVILIYHSYCFMFFLY